MFGVCVWGACMYNNASQDDTQRRLASAEGSPCARHCSEWFIHLLFYTFVCSSKPPYERGANLTSVSQTGTEAQQQVGGPGTGSGVRGGAGREV